MRFRLTLAVLVAVLVLAGTVIRAAYERLIPREETNATRVVMLDVGQGDATIIDGPGDAEVLIDGGPSPDLPHKIGRILGRDRTINLLILSHPHADHLVGLVSILERYEIGRVIVTGVSHTTSEYERFLTIIRDRKIPMTIAVAGQEYDVGPTHLNILAPAVSLADQRVEDLNASSIVIMATVEKNLNNKIQIPNQIQITDTRAARDSDSAVDSVPDIRNASFRMLFTGDAGSDIEAELLEQFCPGAPSPCSALAADILKVGHHGSQTASSAEFLAAVHPTHAFISVGRGNDFGHPNTRTLKRLERASARIWRTDHNGMITAGVAPDGLLIHAER